MNNTGEHSLVGTGEESQALQGNKKNVHSVGENTNLIMNHDDHTNTQMPIPKHETTIGNETLPANISEGNSNKSGNNISKQISQPQKLENIPISASNSAPPISKNICGGMSGENTKGNNYNTLNGTFGKNTITTGSISASTVLTTGKPGIVEREDQIDKGDAGEVMDHEVAGLPEPDDNGTLQPTFPDNVSDGTDGGSVAGGGVYPVEGNMEAESIFNQSDQSDSHFNSLSGFGPQAGTHGDSGTCGIMGKIDGDIDGELMMSNETGGVRSSMTISQITGEISPSSISPLLPEPDPLPLLQSSSSTSQSGHVDTPPGARSNQHFSSGNLLVSFDPYRTSPSSMLPIDELSSIAPSMLQMKGAQSDEEPQFIQHAMASGNGDNDYNDEESQSLTAQYPVQDNQDITMTEYQPIDITAGVLDSIPLPPLPPSTSPHGSQAVYSFVTNTGQNTTKWFDPKIGPGVEDDLGIPRPAYHQGEQKQKQATQMFGPRQHKEPLLTFTNVRKTTKGSGLPNTMNRPTESKANVTRVPLNESGPMSMQYQEDPESKKQLFGVDDFAAVDKEENEDGYRRVSGQIPLDDEFGDEDGSVGPIPSAHSQISMSLTLTPTRTSMRRAEAERARRLEEARKSKLNESPKLNKTLRNKSPPSRSIERGPGESAEVNDIREKIYQRFVDDFKLLLLDMMVSKVFSKFGYGKRVSEVHIQAFDFGGLEIKLMYYHFNRNYMLLGLFEDTWARLGQPRLRQIQTSPAQRSEHHGGPIARGQIPINQHGWIILKFHKFINGVEQSLKTPIDQRLVTSTSNINKIFVGFRAQSYIRVVEKLCINVREIERELNLKADEVLSRGDRGRKMLIEEVEQLKERLKETNKYSIGSLKLPPVGSSHTYSGSCAKNGIFGDGITGNNRNSAAASKASLLYGEQGEMFEASDIAQQGSQFGRSQKRTADQDSIGSRRSGSFRNTKSEMVDQGEYMEENYADFVSGNREPYLQTNQDQGAIVMKNISEGKKRPYDSRAVPLGVKQELGESTFDELTGARTGMLGSLDKQGYQEYPGDEMRDNSGLKQKDGAEVKRRVDGLEKREGTQEDAESPRQGAHSTVTPTSQEGVDEQEGIESAEVSGTSDGEVSGDFDETQTAEDTPSDDKAPGDFRVGLGKDGKKRPFADQFKRSLGPRDLSSMPFLLSPPAPPAPPTPGASIMRPASVSRMDGLVSPLLLSKDHREYSPSSAMAGARNYGSEHTTPHSEVDVEEEESVSQPPPTKRRPQRAKMTALAQKGDRTLEYINANIIGMRRALSEEVSVNLFTKDAMLVIFRILKKGFFLFGQFDTPYGKLLTRLGATTSVPVSDAIILGTGRTHSKRAWFLMTELQTDQLSEKYNENGYQNAKALYESMHSKHPEIALACGALPSECCMREVSLKVNYILEHSSGGKWDFDPRDSPRLVGLSATIFPESTFIGKKAPQHFMVFKQWNLLDKAEFSDAILAAAPAINRKLSTKSSSRNERAPNPYHSYLRTEEYEEDEENLNNVEGDEETDEDPDQLDRRSKKLRSRSRDLFETQEENDLDEESPNHLSRGSFSRRSPKKRRSAQAEQARQRVASRFRTRNDIRMMDEDEFDSSEQADNIPDEEIESAIRRQHRIRFSSPFNIPLCDRDTPGYHNHPDHQETIEGGNIINSDKGLAEAPDAADILRKLAKALEGNSGQWSVLMEATKFICKSELHVAALKAKVEECSAIVKHIDSQDSIKPHYTKRAVTNRLNELTALSARMKRAPSKPPCGCYTDVEHFAAFSSEGGYPPGCTLSPVRWAELRLSVKDAFNARVALSTNGRIGSSRILPAPDQLNFQPPTSFSSSSVELCTIQSQDNCRLVYNLNALRMSITAKAKERNKVTRSNILNTHQEEPLDIGPSVSQAGESCSLPPLYPTQSPSLPTLGFVPLTPMAVVPTGVLAYVAYDVPSQSLTDLKCGTITIRMWDVVRDRAAVVDLEKLLEDELEDSDTRVQSRLRRMHHLPLERQLKSISLFGFEEDLYLNIRGTNRLISFDPLRLMEFEDAGEEDMTCTGGEGADVETEAGAETRTRTPSLLYICKTRRQGRKKLEETHKSWKDIPCLCKFTVIPATLGQIEASEVNARGKIFYIGKDKRSLVRYSLITAEHQLFSIPRSIGACGVVSPCGLPSRRMECLVYDHMNYIYPLVSSESNVSPDALFKLDAIPAALMQSASDPSPGEQAILTLKGSVYRNGTSTNVLREEVLGGCVQGDEVEEEEFEVEHNNDKDMRNWRQFGQGPLTRLFRDLFVFFNRATGLWSIIRLINR